MISTYTKDVPFIVEVTWGKEVEIFSSCISVFTNAQVYTGLSSFTCQSGKNKDSKRYC